MKCSINVWVGDFGTYKVPDDIVSQAKTLNKAKPITDRRTRGFKILEAWGEMMDKAESTLH